MDRWRLWGVRMSSTITIVVPDNIWQMEDQLAEFFNGMVHKLSSNSHKTPPSVCDITKYILLLQGEVLEMYHQWVTDKDDPNLMLELCDVANYAFLVTVSMKLERAANEAEQYKLKGL